MAKTYEDLTPQQQADFDSARAFATAANTVHTNLLNILRELSTHIEGKYYPYSTEDPTYRKALKEKRDAVKLHKAMFERETGYASDLMPGRAAFEDSTAHEDSSSAQTTAIEIDESHIVIESLKK